MKSFALLIAMGVAGVANAAPPAASVDTLAKDYLRLSLAMGPHDAAYVDAYYGPKELQEQAEKAGLSVDAIKAQALALQASLAQQPVPKDEMDALRLRFLQKQTVAMLGRIDVVQGKKLPFDEETARLYDIVAPHHDRAHFEAILRKIDALLPGPGTTAERVVAFRDQFIIPRDKLEKVFKAAIAGCREQTLKHLTLPANESFDLEFVTNKPWGGYNWYKGNYHSLIQVNVELPIYIDRAIDIGCHEGYPGHHVYNMLLEQHLVNERKWLEYSVYPLFSPQSLIAEGSANYGVELAFPPAERRRFEREVLYPAAGLDPALVEKFEALAKLSGELSYAGNESAREYLDGRMTREQAIAWLVEVGLSRPDKAAQQTKFYDGYRSYVINYNVGKDLVKNYVEREGNDEATRWKAFEKILSSPRLPGDLNALPLDKVVVALPQKAGIFVHERSRVGTPEVREGVDADYGVPSKSGDPWIRVTIVPDARVDDASAVAAQAQALEAQVRGNRAYAKLQAKPAVPITVDAPALPSLYANGRIGATRGWQPPVSVGSRQAFTYMDRDGQLTRDVGLVFHRHMADITLRVRVAADDMGEAEFQALADAAAREIVPRLDIRNFGECPGGVRESNCAPDEASAPDAAPVSGVQHTLVYPLVPEPGGCRRNGVVLASCTGG